LLLASKSSITSNAGFLLLMYDTEVLKPSNTGKLIADVIPDTFAFLWSRTEHNVALQAVLDDPKWQPYVVFPQEYTVNNEAANQAFVRSCAKGELSESAREKIKREQEDIQIKANARQVINQEFICPDGKKPLFIMLDGSWREAKKMFRKSSYLDDFPVVSFQPEKISAVESEQDESVENRTSVSNANHSSRYHIRKTDVDYQFSTAEVAARVLDLYGEKTNAKLLDLWFDVFSFQYQKSVCQSNKGNPKAFENFKRYVTALY